MFLGTFEPNILENNRIALPKKIRDELGGDNLILTIGFDNCIFGFTEKEWLGITSIELSKPLFSDKSGRDLRRKMCASAVKINLDAQGRFILPDNMSEYANIKNALVVIGAGDHFEIWNKDNWEEYRTEIG